MTIRNARDLGEIIRTTRNSQKLRQIDLATAAGCGERFIIDLEKGKPTCELEKALYVAQMLGIKIEAIVPGR
jgi:HTH-type transcriptional regulator / antitoxin HipB